MGVVKQRGVVSDSLIVDREIEIDKNTITLNLDNLIQEDQLNVFKQEMLEYLRKNTNNNQVTLKTAIIERKSEKMIYTSKEKYQHLSSQYPNIDILRQKLGLDFNE